MRSIYLCLIYFCIGSTSLCWGQCTNLGQNPSTAFPVCGTSTFIQQSVPICSSNPLFVPGCSGAGNANYENKNPFWYKFTCYQTGSLGFVITPLNLNDDYDWQLYDITGLNPDEAYTNRNIIVTGNWSGSYGTTGASASGVNYIQCASDPADNKPRFAAMPDIIEGHNYLLLISHYTDSQSGYSLSFGGGSAIITDPLEPHLSSASAPCDGTEIRIRTNKKMKCTSLSSAGSDFKIVASNGNIITPISASAASCTNGFDMDSLSVFLSAPLAPGNYKVFMKKGSDQNTLQDNCDREIPVDEQVEFTVYPLFPTPLDSLTKPKCAPISLELVFKKKIKCSSINPSGGDFTITGPYQVTITGAMANCVNGDATKIYIQLSAPMQVKGNFFLNLQAGPDGNTLIDECGVATPPSQIPFEVSDTVNADFSFSIVYSCTKDIVSYFHPGANDVNFWEWKFDTLPKVYIQNPVVTYTNFENKETRLIVSNGVCRDTSSATMVFDNYLKADFEVTPVVCPLSKAIFTNKTTGRITEWLWKPGNGRTASVKDLAPQSYSFLEDADYTVMPQLIATNDYGCHDTATKKIEIVYSCFITVPTAFTPNGDGLNDYLYPLKAYKSTQMNFSVYNRWGQRVFYSQSWLNKWDGTYKGVKQDAGTYVWVLDYVNAESGKHVFTKGTTVLIR